MTTSVTKQSRTPAARSAAFLSASLLLAVLLAGCSDNSVEDPGQTGTPIVTTTVVTTTTTLPPRTAPPDTTIPEGAEDGVVARQADGAAPEELTVTITEAEFSVSTLDVPAGALVTFQSGGLIAYNVVVGDLQPVIVTASLVQSFAFTGSGPVEVTLSEAPGDAVLELNVLP